MKRWFLSGLALAAVLAVAACGADGGSVPGGGTGEGANAFSAYRDCLAQQGIDLPEQSTARPSGFPSGRPDAFPSGRPSGFPSGLPSDRPTAFPSGRQGGGLGGLRPEGVDEETWQKAQTACASVMPTGGPGGFGGNRGGGDRAADTAYRNCLADHGVTADPADATADPKTAAAVEACAVLRPTPTP